MLKMLSKTLVLRHSGHLENNVGSHANELVALCIHAQIGYTKRFAPVPTLSDAWEQNAAPILGCRATRPPWHITQEWPNSTIWLYTKNPFCQVIVYIYSTCPPIFIWFGGLRHVQPMQCQIFTVQTSTRIGISGIWETSKAYHHCILLPFWAFICIWRPPILFSGSRVWIIVIRHHAGSDGTGCAR